MKICSNCKRNYNDDSLSFCLDCGLPLIGGSSNQAATMVMPATETAKQSPTSAHRPNPTTPQHQIHTQTPHAIPHQQIKPPPSNAGRIFSVISILFTLGGILFFMIGLVAAGLQAENTVVGVFVLLSMFIVPIGTLIGLIALYRAFRSRDGQGTKKTAILAILINLFFVLGFVALMLLGFISNYMEGK